MILVDTNILVDIQSRSPAWGSRSEIALAQALARGKAAINDVIFSEFSTGFSDAVACANELAALGVVRVVIPDEALFLAAQAHLVYRRRGGARTETLPDFFIGAHAQALGIPVLTRDKARYESYFPDLAIMTP